MSALEDAQRAEAEALEVLLGEYGYHDSDCDMGPSAGVFCTCDYPTATRDFAEAVRHTERVRAEAQMPANDSFWSAEHKRWLTEYINGKWMPVKATSA